MNGVLVIDKPEGMTSHDVVHRVRKLLGERSVGHLGTLDPMATGVLPLVLGKLTRLAQFYTSAEKTYRGHIRFGFATTTYDADGEPTTPISSARPSLDEVCNLAPRFRGPIQQTPPPFSAKKIRGVPAYKLARIGKLAEDELKPTTVEIKEFNLLSMENDCVAFEARVASGTYMRSVAHEMGQWLGMGAHLASLRRTEVAEFALADAHRLEEFETAVKEGKDGELFVHPRRLLPALPPVTADDEGAGRIRAGRAVNLPELSRAPLVKVFYGQNELICIAERVAGTLFQPKCVFIRN